MAERIASISVEDEGVIRRRTKETYVPYAWVFLLALIMIWAFSWFFMGTIWFGVIASAMLLWAVGVVFFKLNKIFSDLRDGRKRVVSGIVSQLKITDGVPAEFELDYELKTIKIMVKTRRDSYVSLERFDTLPQGGDSRCYVLVIDEKEYQVPRNEFFRYPVGSFFEGDFTMSGVFIR